LLGELHLTRAFADIVQMRSSFYPFLGRAEAPGRLPCRYAPYARIWLRTLGDSARHHFIV